MRGPLFWRHHFTGIIVAHCKVGCRQISFAGAQSSNEFRWPENDFLTLVLSSGRGIIKVVPTWVPQWLSLLSFNGTNVVHKKYIELWRWWIFLIFVWCYWRLSWLPAAVLYIIHTYNIYYIYTLHNAWFCNRQDFLVPTFWTANHVLNKKFHIFSIFFFFSNLKITVVSPVWYKGRYHSLPLSHGNHHIDDLVQDCSISSAIALEILQSSTKPSPLCHTFNTYNIK